MSEREMIEQEIINLECDLTASDYKVIKYTEYVAAKKTPPYDINVVYAERQAKRDRINELRAALEAIDNQEGEV